MNFKNLQIEYTNFEEHISCAHSLLNEIIINLNKFMRIYSKSKHFDKEFAEKLEENLLHLEMFYLNLDNIFEYIENISLNKLKIPEINNIVNIYEYIKIPNNYDEDIFVNLNEPLDFSSFFNSDIPPN